MRKVIKLRESDITKIVRKIIKERATGQGMHTQFPEFPLPGDDPFDGMGSMGGRGNKKISATEVAEVFQAKGVMDVIQKYEKFYSTISPEDRKGVATPDEVRRKGMQIMEDEGGDDTPAAMWIFLGWLAIGVIVYVASHYWPWQCC